ncbi:hypothetical protein E4631_19280 [Hymenobacter sp. UV11]|uniref:hypothetical protein n=1 Tax=Hymenobacter sp. UV11 TaxID=1849735 RepID=UPI00105F44A3|nr:hypothetical protein [Hymenobacter sp. UV11]TDN38041.1 hypothetical protein A8B98_00695 [Hymenobacter sp. UV11]TFZ64655.1 hypothetical protein E4631_19280 [Hymenobacter sp. UV11]
MRHSLPGWLPAACLLLTGPAAAAALPPDSAATSPPPRLTLGLATANRTTYLQRAPLAADDRGYFGTTLTYQAPSGFIASGYLNHSYAYTYLHEPFINFGELMAGWQSVSNSDTYWTVQYTRLFVYGESALVQASLRNDLSASITQFFGLITASASADLFLGGKNDFVLTFDVSHRFQLPMLAHDTLSIEPTVEFGAGSQHFYASSLGQTAVVKTRRNGTTTTTFAEPATPAFSSLGYTFSLPISFAAGRYVVAATPSYLVPLHIPTGGDTSAFFYGTLAVSRTFW